VTAAAAMVNGWMDGWMDGWMWLICLLDWRMLSFPLLASFEVESSTLVATTNKQSINHQQTKATRKKSEKKK
jgi:hypothetical protein